jgi:hypothetical protein
MPLINVGTHELQPGTPNQTVPIYVSGGDAVEGLNLYVGVGDGGALLGGTDGSAPAITGLDIVTGTIFGANNTGQQTPNQTVQFWSASTTTNSGSVSASGLLATIIVDTTGFTAGNSYDLMLASYPAATGVPDSDFGGVPGTFINGTLTIVPEPGALGLLAALAGAALLHRRRRCD